MYWFLFSVLSCLYLKVVNYFALSLCYASVDTCWFDYFLASGYIVSERSCSSSVYGKQCVHFYSEKKNWAYNWTELWSNGERIALQV